MPEMKTLNGYEVVDAKARRDIEAIKLNGGGGGDTPDLSNYATKDEIPTKVSQLQNDSNFITREEVPETDLSEYITESELNAKGYATTSYVDNAVANGPGGSGLTQTMHQHHIALSTINGESNNRNYNNTANVVIINTSSTPFTAQTFVDFLTAGGHTSKENYYPACGGIMNRFQLQEIEATETGLCEVIGVAYLANSISVVYTNPATDASTSTPTGGLASSLVYDPTKGERYDKYYQSFTDKVTSFDAAVVGDTATRGYVDNTASSLRAEIAALRAMVEGG